MRKQFMVPSLILLFVLVCTAGIASSPSTRILVDYEGSWTLQYKILYNEVGNSTVREIYGFGRREITIEREKDFTFVLSS